MAMAQPTGTFTATGSMTAGRAEHTATLLMDGRVLIAGGYTQGFETLLFGHAVTATAELYDPKTGTFTAIGNMTVARANHTATRLADGRVLITGGLGGGDTYNPLASAEIYDPSTGTFTATGNMISPSGGNTNTATLLADGRVLITGTGFSTMRPPSVELYDPLTGTFTAAGNTVQDMGVYTTTLLPDGRILFASYFAPPFTSELYDPRGSTFSLTGGSAGYELQATLLTSGKVLVTGGNQDPGPDPIAELYDPSAGSFTRTGRMTTNRAFHTSSLLSEGKVLIAGGTSFGDGPTYSAAVPADACLPLPYICLPSAELYDPATGLFVNAGNMTAPRAGHTATLLSDGRVLVAGGGSGSITGPTLATAEIYSPDTTTPAPVLLSLSGAQAQAAIQHGDTYQLVTANNPAVAGEILLIYCTGLMDGSVVPPQVAIGGRMAEVLFFGKTPGYAGLNQVNVRVPAGIAPGPTVSVRLTYLGRSSNAVTIGVR